MWYVSENFISTPSNKPPAGINPLIKYENNFKVKSRIYDKHGHSSGPTSTYCYDVDFLYSAECQTFKTFGLSLLLQRKPAC